MAKRFDPFPTSEIPEQFGKTVKAYLLNGVNIAALDVGMPSPTPEWIAEQVQLYNNAVEAWARIATWKKVRWSLCAIRTWGDPDTLTGAQGISGMSLYIKMWLIQKPEADKQPISPCSARVTDPDASPWNYQP